MGLREKPDVREPKGAVATAGRYATTQWIVPRTSGSFLRPPVRASLHRSGERANTLLSESESSRICERELSARHHAFGLPIFAWELTMHHHGLGSRILL
jgi:hypothetical protein